MKKERAKREVKAKTVNDQTRYAKDHTIDIPVPSNNKIFLYISKKDDLELLII